MTAGRVVTDGGRGGRLRTAIKRRVTEPAWLGRAAAVGLCVVSLVFVGGFLAVLGTGGQLALVRKPLPLRVVLVLPYLVAVLAAGTVVGAGLAWRRGYWSTVARVHQTVLAVLALGFVWQLIVLGFLP